MQLLPETRSIRGRPALQHSQAPGYPVPPPSPTQRALSSPLPPPPPARAGHAGRHRAQRRHRAAPDGRQAGAGHHAPHGPAAVRAGEGRWPLSLALRQAALAGAAPGRVGTEAQAGASKNRIEAAAGNAATLFCFPPPPPVPLAPTLPAPTPSSGSLPALAGSPNAHHSLPPPTHRPSPHPLPNVPWRRSRTVTWMSSTLRGAPRT